MTLSLTQAARCSPQLSSSSAELRLSGSLGSPGHPTRHAAYTSVTPTAVRTRRGRDPRSSRHSAHFLTPQAKQPPLTSRTILGSSARSETLSPPAYSSSTSSGNLRPAASRRCTHMPIRTAPQPTTGSSGFLKASQVNVRQLRWLQGQTTASWELRTRSSWLELSYVTPEPPTTYRLDACHLLVRLSPLALRPRTRSPEAHTVQTGVRHPVATVHGLGSGLRPG